MIFGWYHKINPPGLAGQVAGGAVVGVAFAGVGATAALADHRAGQAVGGVIGESPSLGKGDKI